MTISPSAHDEQKLLPHTILDMNYAFARTAILVASVRLHIFTHLAGKALTPAELATYADTLPEPTERLLKGLEALGLVQKTGEVYQLAPTADHFLVEGKPSYLGGDTLAMIDYVPAWFELDRTLRASTPYRDLGEATTAEAFFAPRVIDLFPLIFPIASRLAAELSVEQQPEATLHILDVGAGSAPWSAAFALQHPKARITALDLPAVVAQGRQQISTLGLADRYTWVAVDMENYTFPTLTYDLIVCGHICRFISDERTKALFAKLSQSLRPGGTLLVADVFFTEERNGPPPAITLDLSMLVNSAQGRIRTVSEMSGWLTASGLQHIQRVHLTGPFPVIVAHKEAR